MSLHFDNEQDIQMNSKIHETNGYNHDLDLLIILHQWRVSNPMRSGCREKSIHLKATYTLSNFDGQGEWMLHL